MYSIDTHYILNNKWMSEIIKCWINFWINERIVSIILMACDISTCLKYCPLFKRSFFFSNYFCYLYQEVELKRCLNYHLSVSYNVFAKSQCILIANYSRCHLTLNLNYTCVPFLQATAAWVCNNNNLKSASNKMSKKR